MKQPILVIALLVTLIVLPVPAQLESRTGAQQDEHMGTALAVYDDYNGDGVRDLLVGSPAALTANPEPTVRLVDGAPDGDMNPANDLATLNFKCPVFPSASFVIQRPLRSFGSTIVVLPDLNDDGWSEIAIGAPLANNPAFGDESGSLLIFSGRDGEELLRENGAVTHDHFGVDVALLDPVSPSGPWYLAVGAYGGAGSTGTVYILMITRTGVGPGPTGCAPSPFSFSGQKVRAYSGAALGVVAGGHFGWRVKVPKSMAGGGDGPQQHFDLDSDGFTDILVSAPYDSSPVSAANVGRVVAISGDHITNTIPAAFWWTWGNGADDTFGYDIGVLSDMHNPPDGILDLVVGAPALPLSNGAGFFRVCDGKTGFPINITASPPNPSEVHGNPGDRLGYTVLGIPDVDDWKIPGATAYFDIVAGAPQNLIGPATGAGYVRVYNGGAFDGTGLRPVTVPNFVLRAFQGTQTGEGFGGAVVGYDAKCNAQATTPQGPSLPDLAIGSPDFDAMNVTAGKVTVYGLNPLLPGTWGKSPLLYDPNSDLSELLLETSVGPANMAPAFTGDSQTDMKTVTSATQDIWIRVRSRTGTLEGFPVSMLLGWYETPQCPVGPFSGTITGVHVPSSSPNIILGVNPFAPPSPFFVPPILPINGNVTLQVFNPWVQLQQLGISHLRVIFQAFVLDWPTLPPFFGPLGLMPLPPGYSTSPPYIASNAHEIRFGL